MQRDTNELLLKWMDGWLDWKDADMVVQNRKTKRTGMGCHPNLTYHHTDNTNYFGLQIVEDDNKSTRLPEAHR